MHTIKRLSPERKHLYLNSLLSFQPVHSFISQSETVCSTTCPFLCKGKIWQNKVSLNKHVIKKENVFPLQPQPCFLVHYNTPAENSQSKAFVLRFTTFKKACNMTKVLKINWFPSHVWAREWFYLPISSKVSHKIIHVFV